MSAPLSARGWPGKATAGVLLGFALSLAVSGLIRRFVPVPDDARPAMLQIAMWSMALIWPLIVSFCFLFRSAARAWGWLGLATALAFALLCVG